MSFLNLAAFGFLAFLPLIVILYLLKLRRRPMVVPATLFWRRALEDFSANAPFQKLRKNLLMYLQLLATALLAIALARPLLNLEVRDGRSFLVLIDTSASMLTVEESGRTRFDEAKERVSGLIASMLEGDSMMLITFGARAEVAMASTRDRDELRRRLTTLQPTHTQGSLTEAYLLARYLAAKREAPEIFIVSDGAVEAVAETEAADKVPTRFIKTGLRGANIGFSMVDLRSAPEDPRDIQLFARLINTGGAPADVPLEVRNNDAVVDVRNVRVEANGSTTLTLDGATFEEGTIQLSLETKDPFGLDDQAFITLSRPRETNILMVTAGNYFMEKAIAFNRDLNPKLSVIGSQPTPEQFKASDIVIYDSVSPESIPPGNYIFFNAVPPLEGLGVAKDPLMSPPILDWKSDHPVMEFVELADVAVAKSLDITLPAASLVLAETLDSKPIIAWTSVENRNCIVIAFDLFDTNLPLRMAFPLFVSNMLHFLTQGKAATQASVHRTGGVVELFPPVDTKQILVESPTGATSEVVRNEMGGAPFDATDQIGFHRVSFDGEPGGALGLNLLSEAESRIEPRTSLEIEGTAAEEDRDITKVNREVWNWFGALALLVLLVEWWVYCRRIGL